MSEDSERLKQEAREEERRAEPWANRSDASLVGYVATRPRSITEQAPALVEMQRRLVAALNQFSKESSAQSRRVIKLTVVLAWLTGALLLIGLLQAYDIIRRVVWPGP